MNQFESQINESASFSKIILIPEKLGDLSTF
jgi:hypothetical protein